MKRKLDWRWIGIGIAIMFGLNLIASLLLLPLLGDAASFPVDPNPGVAGSPAMDIGGGRLFLAALLSFLSFAAGGYIVGLRSAGRTVLEPGISAAVAVAIGLLIVGGFGAGTLLASGFVPLLGGWLGERRQRVQAVGVPLP